MRKRSEFEAICWLEVALRRVFVDVIEGGAAVARGAQAHHLARVARLRAGEQVEVSDQVTAYRARTESCTPAEVRFRIEGALPPEPELPRLNVALAIVRFARFEWAVEKLTELGVYSITPLIAARSDAKLVQSAENRAERWRRIVLEAAQQSRRLAAPNLAVPTAFADAVQGCGSDTKLFAEPDGPSVASVCCGHETTLFVGPEGGWTPQESQFAYEGGFRAASLGRNVLRAETAAVALAAFCAGRSGAESGR